MEFSLEELTSQRQDIVEHIAVHIVERNILTKQIVDRKRMMAAEHKRRMDEIRGPTVVEYAENNEMIGSCEARNLCCDLSGVATSAMDMTISAKHGAIPAEKYHGRWLFKRNDIGEYALKVAEHGKHPYREGTIMNEWRRDDMKAHLAKLEAADAD